MVAAATVQIKPKQRERERERVAVHHRGGRNPSRCGGCHRPRAPVAPSGRRSLFFICHASGCVNRDERKERAGPSALGKAVIAPRIIATDTGSRLMG
jgi:hypothetical protein